MDPPPVISRDLKNAPIQGVTGNVGNVGLGSQLAAGEQTTYLQPPLEGPSPPNDMHSPLGGSFLNTNEANVSQLGPQATAQYDWEDLIEWSHCGNSNDAPTSRKLQSVPATTHWQSEPANISSSGETLMDYVQGIPTNEPWRDSVEHGAAPPAWMFPVSSTQTGHGPPELFQGPSSAAAPTLFPPMANESSQYHVPDDGASTGANSMVWSRDEHAAPSSHHQASSSNASTSMWNPTSLPLRVEVTNAASEPGQADGYPQPEVSLRLNTEPDQRSQLDRQPVGVSRAGNADTRHLLAVPQSIKETQERPRSAVKKRMAYKFNTAPPDPTPKAVFPPGQFLRPLSPSILGGIENSDFGVTGDGANMSKTPNHQHEIVFPLPHPFSTKIRSPDGSLVLGKSPISSLVVPTIPIAMEPTTVFLQGQVPNHTEQSPPITDATSSTSSTPRTHSTHDNPASGSEVGSLEVPIVISPPPSNTPHDASHPEIQVSLELTKQKGTRKRAGEPQSSERATKIRHSEVSPSQFSPSLASAPSSSSKDLEIVYYAGPGPSNASGGGPAKVPRPKGYPTEDQLQDPTYLKRAYVCSSCPARFQRTDGLQRHIKGVHKKEIVWWCPVQGCDEACTRKDNGYQHLQLCHHNTCPQCGIQLKPQELDEHLRKPPH